MKKLQIIIILFFSISAFGQKVTYNHIVDSTNVETKEVMILFENYLASNPQNKTKNPFWNIEEQQNIRIMTSWKASFSLHFIWDFPFTF
jgi:hypothetical protein